MAKLISYVEAGGTLVLGLPHLQSSADRTKILSSSEWPFVDPALVERLCGIRIDGPGGPARSGQSLGKTWDLRDPGRGPLQVADVSLRGAEVVGSADGRPLVVEKKLGKGRILLNDDQRRRLAVKAKALGRRLLRDLATIVTPDTLLRWHRELVAQKWVDFSALRKRPRASCISISMQEYFLPSAFLMRDF
jgi:hypothetical protein